MFQSLRRKACATVRRALFYWAEATPLPVPRSLASDGTPQKILSYRHCLFRNTSLQSYVSVRTYFRGDGYERFDHRRRGRWAGLTAGQLRVAVVVTAGGTFIWISSQQEIPYSGRRHAILLNISSEKSMGQQTFAEIVKEARYKGTLLPGHHPASRAVHRVGSRVAAVASDGYGGGFHEHMKGLRWEFAVINSPEVNAFVVPGGKVVVYTGLLKILANEDELAAVLSHEVAHIVARHAAERITHGGILELLRLVAYWVFGLPIPQGPLVAVFFLPNSRKAETEADVIGVQLAARACYDPEAAVEVFSKLGRMEARTVGATVPKFLRTHPMSQDRIARIKEMLPKAESLFEQAGCKTSKGFFSAFAALES